MSDGTPIQRDVDRLLKRGVMFSILWLMGVGSVIAVVSGLRAKRLIEQSKGAISGMGRVWWCLIVGGLGIMFWAPVLAVAIVNNIRG